MTAINSQLRRRNVEQPYIRAYYPDGRYVFIPTENRLQLYLYVRFILETQT